MNPVNFGQTGMNSGNFSPQDPSQVLKMQEFLQGQGLYKGALDSQFGGKSEEAYRNYVNTQRNASGQEMYKNEEGFQATPNSVQQTQATTAGRDPNTGQMGLGGMLKNAYSQVDNKLGGYLPGGVQTQSSIGAAPVNSASGAGGAAGGPGGAAGMISAGMGAMGGALSAMGKSRPQYGQWQGRQT